MSDLDERIHDTIASHGWFVMKILENEHGPGFAYSLGLYKTFGHPEIVVIGLDLDVAHRVINVMGAEIRAGAAFLPGTQSDAVFEGYSCAFVAVPEALYRDYFGYCIWLYQGIQFPVIQCVYPAKNGAFPWDAVWPAQYTWSQPVLGEWNINPL